MLNINTNVASLNAQRNISSSQNALSTSLQRLSSGLRINSAKDDAAGLAISERMTSQIRGLDQARRNANDGISLAQTAEGALGEIGNNLQRMRELSVQAANGTNSATDRASLQAEVLQLRDEIDRVAAQTDFNGTKLLSGSAGSLTFQVGAKSNEVISITSLSSAKSTDLGTSTYATATGTTISPTGANDLSALAGSVTGTSLATGGFKINGFTITGSDMTVGDNTKVTAEEYKKYMTLNVAAINAQSADTGVTASLNVATNGDMSISFNSQQDIVVAAGGVAAFDGGDLGIDVVDGTTAAKGDAQSIVGFNSIDVSSVSGANKAMVMLDSAINAVNSMRGDLGAVQNRFESTITNLQVGSENMNASRSRILDADFASETAKLSRNQVLQQAGTAMLAQANQLPQNVLSLLR